MSDERCARCGNDRQHSYHTACSVHGPDGWDTCHPFRPAPPPPPDQNIEPPAGGPSASVAATTPANQPGAPSPATGSTPPGVERWPCQRCGVMGDEHDPADHPFYDHTYPDPLRPAPTQPTDEALRALVEWANNPKPSPNVPGCDCRNPDETWDDVDEDEPLLLCVLHDRRWGAVQRDTAIAVLIDLEAALYEGRRLIANLAREATR